MLIRWVNWSFWAFTVNKIHETNFWVASNEMPNYSALGFQCSDSWNLLYYSVSVDYPERLQCVRELFQLKYLQTKAFFLGYHESDIGEVRVETSHGSIFHLHKKNAFSPSCQWTIQFGHCKALSFVRLREGYPFIRAEQIPVSQEGIRRALVSLKELFSCQHLFWFVYVFVCHVN